MGSNMLLKHLMVFDDFGGEPMQRLRAQRHTLFSSGATTLDILFNMDEYSLDISNYISTTSRMDNPSLGLDGPSLATPREHTELTLDLSVILAFGALASNSDLKEVLSRCDAALWFQKEDDLDSHFQQRYLDVNRIVGGARANSLGQILQRRVKNAIENRYSDFDDILTNASIDIGGEKVTSDILIRKGDKAVAIEVAFQETTNSTIERKGTDAHKRKILLNSVNTASVYVLDGAGNFQRQSAITKLCNESDCTVAFSESEFDLLVEFIKDWFE